MFDLKEGQCLVLKKPGPLSILFSSIRRVKKEWSLLYPLEIHIVLVIFKIDNEVKK